MTWARLDDRLHDNRKIKRLWRTCPTALGLHMMAITYCAGNETDGLVDAEFVHEKCTAPRERDKMTTALVNAGLWDVEGEDWRIHGYLEFNPSRATLDEKREADAARKRRGRATQSAKRPRGAVETVRDLSARSPNGVRAESSGPDPTRPVNNPPSPPRGERGRDHDRYEKELRQYAAQLLPDEWEADDAETFSAVRSAVGVLRDRGAEPAADIVAGEARYWLGHDTSLPDDQRERIRELGRRAQAINQNAKTS